MKKTLFIIALLIAFSAIAHSQKNLTANEAKDHVGEVATVCGIVASARYLPNSKGQPTFLNFDKAYPDNPFMVVIWGANRSNFGEPEKAYLNKKVCVTGRIEEYRGKPQIEAKEKKQIRVSTD